MPSKPVPLGQGRTRRVWGLDPVLGDLAGRGGDWACPARAGAFSVWVQGQLSPRMGRQVSAKGLRSRRRNVALLRFACIVSWVMMGAGPAAVGPAVAGSGRTVRLAGLGDLVLRDHDAGVWVTAASRWTFLFPLACAFCVLAVHGHGVAGRDMPRIPRDRGIQPRVQRVRPEPAALPLLAEAPRRWRLLLPLLLLLLPQLLLPLRGGRGRDLRGQRRVRQRRGQGGLELIRVQAFRDPLQRPRRRRGPQPSRRADRATVGGQQFLAPARSRLRDRQRPPVPARGTRHQHRYHRRELMADPPPPPPSVSRAASARRSAPGSGASPPPRWRRTASISDDASTGAALHGDVSDGQHPNRHHGPRPHRKHIRLTAHACRVRPPRFATESNRHCKLAAPRPSPPAGQQTSPLATHRHTDFGKPLQRSGPAAVSSEHCTGRPCEGVIRDHGQSPSPVQSSYQHRKLLGGRGGDPLRPILGAPVQPDLICAGQRPRQPG